MHQYYFQKCCHSNNNDLIFAYWYPLARGVWHCFYSYAFCTHTHKPIWLLSMYLFMLMILTSNKTNNGKSPLISFYTLLQLSDLNKSFKTVWCSFPKNHQLILKSFGSKFFGFFSFPKLKFHFIALMIYVLPWRICFFVAKWSVFAIW